MVSKLFKKTVCILAVISICIFGSSCRGKNRGNLHSDIEDSGKNGQAEYAEWDDAESRTAENDTSSQKDLNGDNAGNTGTDNGKVGSSEKSEGKEKGTPDSAVPTSEGKKTGGQTTAPTASATPVTQPSATADPYAGEADGFGEFVIVNPN